MHTSSYHSIRYSVDNQVAAIVLNRPDRLNALNRSMLVELGEAIRAAAADKTVKAVLLSGEGRAFCAGQDLGERDPRKLDGPLDLGAIQREIYHPIIAGMASMEKPVVVAVNGIAAGAGSAIALGGDIVIAACSSRFIQSYVNVGLSVDAGGGWHLVKALGPARARALLMTGGEISASEAQEAGLIWKCVADEDLKTFSGEIAKRLAEGPATALACIKKAVAAVSAATDYAHYIAVEADLQQKAGMSPDYGKNVLAFLEKKESRHRA